MRSSLCRRLSGIYRRHQRHRLNTPAYHGYVPARHVVGEAWTGQFTRSGRSGRSGGVQVGGEVAFRPHCVDVEWSGREVDGAFVVDMATTSGRAPSLMLTHQPR